jgi:hypothetical protein
LSRLLSKLQDTWRKNWPEVRCGLTGGLPGFIFNRDPQPFDPGVPVFCYHVVGHDTFRADLAFLKDNGYATLGADELLEHLESRKPAPPRSVVLSFDDGQETLHTVAYPLLIEFGFKAVAFICPGLHREPDDAGAQPHGGLCDWQQIRQMHERGGRPSPATGGGNGRRPAPRQTGPGKQIRQNRATHGFSPI